MNKKTLIIRSIAVVCVAIVIYGVMKARRVKDITPLEEVVESRELFGIKIDSLVIDSGIVKNGESLSTILLKNNLDYSDVYELTEASKDIFDVRSLRAGHPYMILSSLDDTLNIPQYFIYGQDKINYVVFSRGDSVTVEKHKKEVDIKTKTLTAEIKGSFWNTVVHYGQSAELVMRVSDIFQWTVDFYGIASGDSFNIIYDERSVDGEIVGIGDIHAGWFKHQGKRYYAVHFKDSTHNGYWDETGASLKKAFLKAPLRYSRISSTYSNSRYHPVLKIYRPHHGVDYAAPTGTPVEAVADGVVTCRSYRGGAGNCVKIKHFTQGGRFVTGYMHLSRYAKGLRVGSQVKQGQVIGYVGMTGLASGPHLDYRIWSNGKTINPLKINQQKGEPLKGEILKKYMPIKDSMINKLENIYKLSIQKQIKDTLKNEE